MFHNEFINFYHNGSIINFEISSININTILSTLHLRDLWTESIRIIWFELQLKNYKQDLLLEFVDCFCIFSIATVYKAFNCLWKVTSIFKWPEKKWHSRYLNFKTDQIFLIATADEKAIKIVSFEESTEEKSLHLLLWPWTSLTEALSMCHMTL